MKESVQKNRKKDRLDLRKIIRNLAPNRQTLMMLGGCLCVAILFVLLRSYSTSPLYPGYYAYGGMTDGGDSLQFLTMGKLWLAGKVPYAGFFDHKGPLVFFCDMLGFWLGGGSRFGVMILQIIALTVAFFYILRTAQLVSKNILWGGMVLLASLVYLAVSYVAGNSVQEWNLPFIAMATYYMVKYFYQDKKAQESHDPKYALIYGVAIGACFLAQVTNAIFLCAGVLVILCVLVKQGAWANLGKNLLYGAIGLGGIMLPFVIYFIATGVLGEFFYYTFIYNISYTAGVGSWLRGATGELVTNFLMIYLPFITIFFTAGLAMVRKKYAYAVMLLLVGGLEAYMLFSTQAWNQYALPLLPQLALFLNEVYLLRRDDEAWRILQTTMITLFLICTYDLGRAQIGGVVDTYNAIRAADKNGIGYEKLLAKHEDEIRAGTFSAFAHNELKSIYLRYDLTPNNRFFIIQSWHASMNEDLAKEVHQDYVDNRAEYLLLDEQSLENEYNINDVLDEYYEEIDKDGIYHLYRLIDVPQKG